MAPYGTTLGKLLGVLLELGYPIRGGGDRLLLLLLLHVLFHELLNLLLLLLPDLPVIEAPLRLSLCLEPRHGTAQGWRGAGEPGEMACLCRWY